MDTSAAACPAGASVSGPRRKGKVDSPDLDKVKILDVSFGVADEDRAYAAKAYNVDLRVRCRGPSVANPHVRSKIDSLIGRWSLATTAITDYRKGSPPVLVVGGDVSELSDYDLNHTVPVESCDPCDGAAAKIHLLTPTHRCKLQDVPTREYSALLMNHSLYYIPPGDVLESMVRLHCTKTYALVHQFPRTKSGLGVLHAGELRYQLLPDSQVRVKLRGSTRNFVHSDLSWLESGHGLYRLDGFELAWDVTRVFGSVVMVQFVLRSEQECFESPEDCVPIPADDPVEVLADEAATHVIGGAVLPSSILMLSRIIRSKLSDGVGRADVLRDAVALAVNKAVAANTRIVEVVRASSDAAWQQAASLRDFGHWPDLGSGITDSLKRWADDMVMSVGSSSSIVTAAIRSLLRRLRSVGGLCWLVRIVNDSRFLIPGLAVETALSVVPLGCAFNCGMEMLSGLGWPSLLHLVPIFVPWWLFAMFHVFYDLSYALLVDPIVVEDVCVGPKSREVAAPTGTLVHGDLAAPCSAKVGCVCVAFHGPWSCLVARQCAHNLVKGLVERVLFEKPAVEAGFWESMPYDWIPRVAVRVDLDAYLKHLSPAKRANFVRYTGYEINPRALQKGDYVRAFVKQEKLMKAGAIEEGSMIHDFKPRIISMRSPEYQQTFGPTCWAIGVEMKNWTAPVSYGSGKDSLETGNWYSLALLDIGDPAVVENDFSSFDGTVGVEALRFQYKVMRECFSVDLPFETDLVTRGCSARSGQVFYTVPGTRKSGNNDTSVGNSILNACVCVLAARLSDIPDSDLRVLVAGDDSVCVVPKSQAARFAAQLEGVSRRAGFKSKVSVRPSILQVSFCSSWFVMVSPLFFQQVWKPGLMLSKVGWWCKPPRDWRFLTRRWLRALAVNLGLAYWWVPVCRALALRLYQVVVDGTVIGYTELRDALRGEDFDAERNMLGDHDNRWCWRYFHEPGRALDVQPDADSTMTSFLAVYDISREEVVRAESELLSLPRRLPWELDNPTIRTMIRVDCDEPFIGDDE